jgi:hypothetical protein
MLSTTQFFALPHPLKLHCQMNHYHCHPNHGTSSDNDTPNISSTHVLGGRILCSARFSIQSPKKKEKNDELEIHRSPNESKILSRLQVIPTRDTTGVRIGRGDRGTSRGTG